MGGLDGSSIDRPPVPPYDPKIFYQAEYVALRAEILQNIIDLRALERYVAAACATVWAWVAAHLNQQGALFVPLVISVLGGLRALAYLEGFKYSQEYIAKIEEFLGSNGQGTLPGGWEHRLPLNSGEGKRPWWNGMQTLTAV